MSVGTGPAETPPGPGGRAIGISAQGAVVVVNLAAH